MTKSYIVTKNVPVGWPEDELAKFIELATGNVVASFVQLPDFYAKCRDVDAALLLICSNLSDAGDWFAPFFALKSHAAFRAAAQLALAT